MGNVCWWSFGDSIYKSMECPRTLGYHDGCNDNWSCILRNDRGVFMLSPWDFHVRTSSGKYAWMRGTASCNDSSATVLAQAFGMIDVVGILCIVGAVTALTVVDA